MRVLLIDDKPRYGGIASHNRLLIQGLKLRGVDGNEAAMRTPTDYFENTFPKAGPRIK